MKGIVIGAVMALGTMASANALAVSYSPWDYNLVTEGDYTHLGGSVWGRAFIGGDLKGGASEFAQEVPVIPVEDTVAVGGSITASHVKIKSGNLVVTDASKISGGSHVEFHGGGSVVENAGLSVEPIFSSLKTASSDFSMMNANGDFNGGNFSYSGGEDVAVFYGSADTIFAQNTQFNFSGVDAETVIINVSGSVIDAFQGNNTVGFNLNSTTGLGASNILWNFYEAIDLDLGSSSIVGSILAVYADVDLMSTVDGSLFAKSVVSQRQIHDYYFEPPTSVVPVPASLPLLLLGLGGVVGFLRRQNSKKQA